MVGDSPSPNLLQALHKERTLLLGGSPPTPPLHLLLAVRCKRALLLKGCPPLLSPLAALLGNPLPI